MFILEDPNYFLIVLARTFLIFLSVVVCVSQDHTGSTMLLIIFEQLAILFSDDSSDAGFSDVETSIP